MSSTRWLTCLVSWAALLVCACGLLAGSAQRGTPQLKLKYVAIVTRHGVRSPTWTLERLNQYSSTPWPDWGTAPGNLTSHGRSLMGLMGKFYAEYLGSQGLLRLPGCADSRRVYLWADTDQRTMETARALAESILPGCMTAVHSLPSDATDPLFDPIDAGAVKPDPQLAVAAVRGQLGPRLDAIVDAHRGAFDTLQRVLNGEGKAAASIFDSPVTVAASGSTVAMSGPLSLASTLTEDFLLEYTDGWSGPKLGWGRLDASSLQRIMSLHTAYADLMRRTRYLARARGSNLLSRVLGSMEQSVIGKSAKGAIGGPETNLLIVSGHDTNLSNLSGLLDLSWVLPTYQPDDTPPGGALLFSLWQASGSTAYNVRVQYIAQTMDQMHDATPLSVANPPAIADVFVPGCSRAEPGFPCSWPAFQAAVRGAIDPAFVP